MRLFAVVFLFACFQYANAQLVNIPDPAFRTYLKSLSALNSCWVGDQLNVQCAGVGTVRTLRPPFRSGVIQLSGIQYFTNLDTLSINQLYNVFELPNLPAQLRYLDCSGNPMPLLPQLPPTLQTLLIEGCGMADLPPLPRGLRYLNCNYNTNLNFPPVLPDSLRLLSIFNNQIKSLPALPSQLRTLVVGFNQMTTLPALPSHLEVLSLNNTPIQCLPRLPETLRQLVVANTQVTCLPNRPATLTTVDVSLPVCNSPCRIVTSLDDLPVSTVRVWHKAGLHVDNWPQNTPAEGWQIRIYNVAGQFVAPITLTGATRYALELQQGFYLYQIVDKMGRIGGQGNFWISE